MRRFPMLQGEVGIRSDQLVAWLPADAPQQDTSAGWLHVSQGGSRRGSESGFSQKLAAELVARQGFEFANLAGDRTIAWIDPGLSELTVVRNPMGLQPVYYRTGPGFVAAASTAAALKFPDQDLTIDPAWIARYSWLTQSEDLERTPYREIHKLPPGYVLIARPGEPPVVRQWYFWDAHRTRIPDGHGADWAAAYREELLSAVGVRLGDQRPVAVEASGGLDSSALLAAALQSGRLDAGDLCALGYANCEEEPAAIAKVLDHLNIGNRHIYEMADVVTAPQVDRALGAIGYPEENSIASSHWRLLDEAAAQGARVLLSGYGGDEIVSRPGLEARSDMVAARDLANLHRSFAGGLLRRTAATAWQLLPRPVSLSARAERESWLKRWSSNLLTDEAAESFGVREGHERALDGFLAGQGVNAVVTARHLRSASMTTRFESCYLVGQAHGVDYRWPLCDHRLIELYLAAPPQEKLGPGGVGRYLHRRAMAPWLPGEVAWRPRKYMGPMRDAPLTRGLAMSDWATPDLAPGLRGIIDPGKVAAARQRLAGSNAVSMEALAVRSSLVRLAWLNRWLETESG